MLPDYKQLVNKYGVICVEDLISIFKDEIVYYWVDMHKAMGVDWADIWPHKDFMNLLLFLNCTEMGGDPDIIASNIPDSRL